MGWVNSVVGTAKKAAGGVMGYTTGITDRIFGGGGDKGGGEYDAQMAQARGDIQKGYAKARPAMTKGYEDAAKTYESAYAPAAADTQTGFAKAQQQLATGGQQAQDTAKAGYKEAQGRYDTNEMVASRGELYNRVLGKGGLDAATMDKMRAGEVDAAGRSLKTAQRGISKMAGDSTAGGLAAENMGRVTAQVGADKAAALRGLDVENARLAREEQTGAMSALSQEAGARAGLSAQEAQYVSGLQEQLAQGTANLTQAQTTALADMAMQRGDTLSGLKQKLADGQATLTVEEAKALAELAAGAASAKYAAAQNQGGGLLSGIFG